MTGPSHRQAHRATVCAVLLLSLGTWLTGCTVLPQQSDPLSTDDASPTAFRPLYNKILTALDESTGSQMPHLRKLFPGEPAAGLENVVNLCGKIDPQARRVRFLRPLDPFHIMTGRLTGRERGSAANTGCGLALMWASNPGPAGGRHWEIQAWSLGARSSRTPTPSALRE